MNAPREFKAPDDLCQCRKMFDLVLNHNDRAVVLLGQAPSKKGNPERPLTGRTVDYMTDLLGVTRAHHFRSYARLNLNHYYSGRSNGADRFDLGEASRILYEIESSIRGRRIVIFGRKTSRIFGMESLPFLTWYDSGNGPRAIVPHTSGLNRWWNSSDNRQQASEFFKALQEATA